MEISDKLKMLREEREITKSEAAKLIGTTASLYGMWESGKTDPCAESVIKISQAFSVPVDWLINDKDESAAPKIVPKGYTRMGKYLWKSPDGEKTICTKEHCEYQRNCGDGVTYCPGSRCMKDDNFQEERETRMLVWFLKMFALLASNDI